MLWKRGVGHGVQRDLPGAERGGRLSGERRVRPVRGPARLRRGGPARRRRQGGQGAGPLRHQVQRLRLPRLPDHGEPGPRRTAQGGHGVRPAHPGGHPVRREPALLEK